MPAPPTPPPPPFVEVDLDDLSSVTDRRDGKVRCSYALPDGSRLFVTTDRLSAFDRVLQGVPWKGQVLNELAAWWFAQTEDLVANHVLDVPDPNATIARSAAPLPVEVVVRGRITGVTDTALWTHYARGDRVIYGHRLPDGLRKNDELPDPIITPTTKGSEGGHDVPITLDEVVTQGLVDGELWQRVCDAALAVFARGATLGAAAGLVLADTKYEFGLGPDGDLLLIDEVHTPDSSRWWIADTLDDRLAAGEEPESLDKEVVRRALADAGFRGDGPVPTLDESVWSATTARYVDAYERLTGQTFEPGAYPVEPRLRSSLRERGIT